MCSIKHVQYSAEVATIAVLLGDSLEQCVPYIAAWSAEIDCLLNSSQIAGQGMLEKLHQLLLELG